MKQVILEFRRPKLQSTTFDHFRQSSEKTFGIRVERNKVYCKQVKEFTVDKNQKTIKGAKTLRLFLVDF